MFCEVSAKSAEGVEAMFTAIGELLLCLAERGFVFTDHTFDSQ